MTQIYLTLLLLFSSQVFAQTSFSGAANTTVIVAANSNGSSAISPESISKAKKFMLEKYEMSATSKITFLLNNLNEPEENEFYIEIKMCRREDRNTCVSLKETSVFTSSDIGISILDLKWNQLEAQKWILLENLGQTGDLEISLTTVQVQAWYRRNIQMPTVTVDLLDLMRRKSITEFFARDRTLEVQLQVRELPNRKL